MRKQWVPGMIGVGVSAVLSLVVAAALAADAEAPKHAYIGVKGCRMCHNTKKQGEQTTIWQGTKHAKAFETLKTDAAIKVAKDKGLTKPPSESPECLRCHASAWNLSEDQKAKFVKSGFKIEEGVQCETCHGPGDDYKSIKVMKDRKAAIEAGMMVGDEKLCITCHNEQSPNWNPEKYTTKDGKKVGFDYAAAWEKIKHPVPKE